MLDNKLKMTFSALLGAVALMASAPAFAQDAAAPAAPAAPAPGAAPADPNAGPGTWDPAIVEKLKEVRKYLYDFEKATNDPLFVVLDIEKLLASAGQVLSRAQLEESLYGWGGELESNAVDVHIHNLRRKLYPEVIRTVRGIGYVADPPSGAK